MDAFKPFVAWALVSGGSAVLATAPHLYQSHFHEIAVGCTLTSTLIAVFWGAFSLLEIAKELWK